MKLHPITFSPDSINGIIEERKHQTRRVIKPQPKWKKLEAIRSLPGDLAVLDGDLWKCSLYSPNQPDAIKWRRYAPIAVGDRLWIKEAWQSWAEYDSLAPSDIPPNPSAILYTADRPEFPWDSKKRSPMFMPRWASRLTLEVCEVRIQRLCSISEEDCAEEGITTDRELGWYRNGVASCSDDLGTGRPPGLWAHYALVWDALNRKRPGCSWVDNPFVSVYGFRVMERKR